MSSFSAMGAFPFAALTTEADARRRRVRLRRVTPQAGHALEILGHAIDYLTDEFIHAGGSFYARDAQVEAVQLLMRINRQIYFECPEAATLTERFLALLHLRKAASSH